MLGFDLQKISLYRRFQTDFEDLGELGSGGFATVHKVRHKIEGKLYAAKIIQIKPSSSRDDTQERFYKMLSEAKTHSWLNHQNVLKIHGCWMELQSYSQAQKQELLQEQQKNQPDFQMVFFDDQFGSNEIAFGSASENAETMQTGNTKEPSVSFESEKKAKIGDGSLLTDYKEIRIYMLLELCEINLQSFIAHRSFQNRREQRSCLQNRNKMWKRNYELIMDLVSGLRYLHSKRIIHRDIKLHNIMLDERGKCKIIDFGLAKKVKYWKSSIEDSTYTYQQKSETFFDDEGDERFSSRVGTKLFSSPEQSSSDKYDYRTDIYSLAIVIVLLFSSFTTVHEQRDLLQKIRMKNLEGVDMPVKLKGLVFKCLGAENQRASLKDLQLCLKELVRQDFSLSKSQDQRFQKQFAEPSDNYGNIKVGILELKSNQSRKDSTQRFPLAELKLKETPQMIASIKI